MSLLKKKGYDRKSNRRVLTIIVIVAIVAVVGIMYWRGGLNASADAVVSVESSNYKFQLSPEIRITSDAWSKDGGTPGYINVKVGSKSRYIWLVSEKKFTYTVSSSNAGLAQPINLWGRPVKQPKVSVNSGTDGIRYVSVFGIKGKRDGGASVVLKSGKYAQTIKVSVQGDDDD